MGTVRTLLAAPLLVLSLGGCLFKAFEEQNEKDFVKERAHNQTLAKASLILDAVQEWSARHGGEFPSPTQFKAEIGPLVKGRKGADVSAAEVEDSFGRFVWTFPGGRVSDTPGEVEVGHLSEASGDAIAYANGEVRRWRPIPPPPGER